MAEPDRLAEINRNNSRLSLIRESKKILCDSVSRKVYDMQRKTIKGSSHKNLKNNFEEFIKLQQSEITEKSRENAKNTFKMLNDEMDKKHSLNRELLEKKPVDVKDATRLYNDIIQQRDDEYIDLMPKNKFQNKEFNNIEFNKLWEMNKKKNKKNDDENKDLMLWEGVYALNDTGFVGDTNFVKLDDMDNLYNEGKKYSNMINVDDITMSNSEDESSVDMDSIDVSYVTDHNKNKLTENNDKYLKALKERKEFDINQASLETFDNYWKSVKDNPMNISSQMDKIIGGFDHKQLEFNMRDKYIDKNELDAYKSLVYEEDKEDKDINKIFKKKHKHRNNNTEKKDDTVVHKHISKHHKEQNNEILPQVDLDSVNNKLKKKHKKKHLKEINCEKIQTEELDTTQILN